MASALARGSSWGGEPGSKVGKPSATVATVVIEEGVKLNPYKIRTWHQLSKTSPVPVQKWVLVLRKHGMSPTIDIIISPLQLYTLDRYLSILTVSVIAAGVTAKMVERSHQNRPKVESMMTFTAGI